MTLVLVTGGGGFIGSHLVNALVAQGREVRILDIRPPTYIRPGVQHLVGSILDPLRVDEALDGVGEVYHLAALPGMWTLHRDDFNTVNCGGTAVMLAAARKRGVSRFLYCSTESILFGRSATQCPIDEEIHTPLEEMPGVYTRSKKAAELLALRDIAAGAPIVIASPTMPIGPHDAELTPPTAMLRHFLSRRLQFYFDFMLNVVDVRDVAAGLILALERGRPGQRYILGGENISLKRLLDLSGAIAGPRQHPVPIPASLARAVAWAMEFIADRRTQRPPAATVEAIEIALRSRELSIDKARRELGYMPRSAEMALRDTISWIERRDGQVDPSRRR